MREPDLLTLSGVVAGYRAGGNVLQGVDLSVRSGTIACIVGPNGAGKSTVLKVISGLLAPREGTVHLDGRSIGGRSPADILARGVVQVPQSGGLFPRMSVKENVLLGAFTLRRRPELIARRLAEVEELFPLVADRAAQPAGNLSGGQRRIVEFARALILAPALVLLDEPSVGLDPVALRLAHDSIRQMREAGRTVVLIEQNVRFGLRLAMQAIVMEGGRVRLQGPAAEVLADPGLGDLYFGGSASTG